MASPMYYMYCPHAPRLRLVSELAERTTGYSGADIKALAAEATLCALRSTYPQVCCVVLPGRAPMGL
jgi:ATP-dependent Zn protease